MDTFDANGIMESLKEIVVRAGDIVKDGASRTRKIRLKGRIDLVTETDLAVETMLKSELIKLLPDSDFLAEETAKNTDLGKCTWVIDPLDGTTNFAHGLPFVANSIGLWRHDRVVMGVINLPLMGEMFTAVEGQGAFLNGNSISVTDETDMEKSLLATGFPYDIEENLEDILKNLKVLLPLTRGIRRPGAAAMDLAYVACGRFEGFYERALNPWDTAAGILLVKEAGGMVSEYDTSRPYTFESGSILATNGGIHEELSRLLTAG
ncbi:MULTISPECIES: inositol monophosphatase family protein [unclassified Pseudodesulfovibrio]|uniref:inositol monophosphatase family protein n=1 Tax=unclassified Pseudodesulfovibrio TaxID=2661612 RepID=UPI000FEBFB01|nr:MULTISPECIES: inositol monophosphatase family protein [unclassified Pseudodesulfovibrio]MCJ2163834.1 inositol monophosphatase [Pseudodesulfovibrio sp. S3-i]RWU05919.1 inositol monophosphatase [Pseudodesulfovibrio sp. S3]